MSVLITGSMAYDTIMVFPDSFKNHIIPEKVHILNVCFLVPELRKEFGGCAGNIAYNLNMLGVSSLPMATVGEDFKPYRKWLKKCGTNQQCITKIENTFTAQAYLTTDMDDNQIIAFHPGAMNHAHQNKIADALPGLGIVAAVLGIVITMNFLTEGPEKIGLSVAAALVGTFLGIWMGYGFVGPTSIALEHAAKYELKAYECVKSAIVATVSGQAPQMAIEFGRKALPTDKRPGFQELNDHVRSK